MAKDEEEEVIEINLKAFRNFFKRKKENKKPQEKEETEEEDQKQTPQVKNPITKEANEEEININFKKFFSFFKKNYVIFLILIPMLFSIFFRAYPFYLPITNEWARNSVYNSIQAQIKLQIDEQYPNLPDINKAELVKEQFQEFLKQNKKEINSQIKTTSRYFKSRMKNEDGQTYLLAIDPWLWYGEARNYIKYGRLGDKIINGKEIYSLRNGRYGRSIGKSVFNQLFEANLYKIMHFFNKNTTLMFACFITPLIIITLAVIPAFFIGKKLGGNMAGFFSGMIVAINSALLSRTPAGFADTDPYNILFPLLIAWMFIESFEARNIKKTLLYAVLCSFFIGIYSRTWNGWSFIANFIFFSLAVCFVYYFIKSIIEKKTKKFFKQKEVKNVLILFFSIMFLSILFVSLFGGSLSRFEAGIKGPLRFAKIKDVATTTLWPNVFTTVAEFNEVPLSSIINQMGGKFLFLIAIIGVILPFFVKKQGKRDVMYTSFLVIWFLGTLYAFTKGTRFALLMVPAFAIAFGLALGIGERYISKWLSKEMKLGKTFARSLVIFIFLLFLINPIINAHNTALHETPSMTDAWYNSLVKIKENETRAIITSWWDFGHWFTAIAERHVTFDGADQGRRIHWVGKTLLTDNETVAIGILRMLNCGQEYAFDKLNSHINDTLKSINLLNEIIVVDKEKAKEILKNNGLDKEAINEVLNLTHCEDIIPQFYITSDDMIGKAGVWSHFGSWDFKRAKMWNKVRRMNKEEGISLLVDEFNLTQEEAERIFQEIKTTKADQWITGWYGYRSSPSNCQVKDNKVICGNGLEVDLKTMEAFVNTNQGKKHPFSLVYATKDDVKEKRFKDDIIPFSVALIPDDTAYLSFFMDKELAMSMFTRLYFFNGHGLRHFKLFSDEKSFIGQRIIIWKVDFKAGEKNIAKEFMEKAKQGSTVSINYIAYFENGSVFDSNIIKWEEKNITKDTPFSSSYAYKKFQFTIGNNEVIKGLEEGVKGMSIGDEREITIPPKLAYKKGSLANKTLIYKVRLVDIK